MLIRSTASLILCIFLSLNVVAQRATFSNNFNGSDHSFSEKGAGGGTSQKSKTQKTKTSVLAVGPDVKSYKYEEPGFVEHNGVLYGVWGKYETELAQGVLSVDSVINYGGLTYTGALCDTGTGICTPYQTSNQTDLINRTVVAYHFPMSDVMSLKAGLGIRYLRDTVSESGFYTRTGTWAFLPLGANFSYPIESNLRLIVDLDYDYVFYGGIKSNLSQVSSQLEDVYSTQSGSGLSFEVGAIYSDLYHASIYYQTWNLNESDITKTGNLNVQEPKNNSTSIGIKLGYDFF